MLRCLGSVCLSLLLGLALPTGAAQATVIIVDAHANGGFGSSSGGTLGIAMLPFDIAGPASFEISATGLISICNGCAVPLVGPDGLTLADTPFGNGEIVPLEERDNIDPDPSEDVGALIGAFVATGTPGTAGFDEDIGGDVAAASLFLIGSGPFLFTAPGAGRLYLGINDSFVANDSGSFTVTIEEVQVSDLPEPGTLALLAWGAVTLGALRRRKLERPT